MVGSQTAVARDSTREAKRRSVRGAHDGWGAAPPAAIGARVCGPRVLRRTSGQGGREPGVPARSGGAGRRPKPSRSRRRYNRLVAEPAPRHDARQPPPHRAPRSKPGADAAKALPAAMFGKISSVSSKAPHWPGPADRYFRERAYFSARKPPGRRVGRSRRPCRPCLTPPATGQPWAQVASAQPTQPGRSAAPRFPNWRQAERRKPVSVLPCRVGSRTAFSPATAEIPASHCSVVIAAAAGVALTLAGPPCQLPGEAA